MSEGFVLFNAGSGSAGEISPAAILAQFPQGTKLHELSERDDPVEVTRRAVEGGARWVAVAGGDGTVEAVAAALVGSEIPLGVIPSGTYNNFARSAGIPVDLTEAIGLIQHGAMRKIDVGFVNGKPFFECVGIGLDAAIFPVGEEIKSGGFWQWFKLFAMAARYPRQTFELTLDRPFKEAIFQAESPPRPSRSWLKRLRARSSPTIRVKALMVTVSNGPFYGANFAVAPHASIDDGIFTITIFKRYNKLELLWHFWSISAGRRKYAPRVVTLRASEVMVKGPRVLEVHKDGTPLRDWPVQLAIKPQALTIFSKN